MYKKFLTISLLSINAALRTMACQPIIVGDKPDIQDFVDNYSKFTTVYRAWTEKCYSTSNPNDPKAIKYIHSVMRQPNIGACCSYSAS